MPSTAQFPQMSQAELQALAASLLAQLHERDAQLSERDAAMAEFALTV